MSCPCRVMGKIVYMTICVFTEETGKRVFWTEWLQPFPEFMLLIISSWERFYFITVIS
jgi:hypothetical protein